MSDNEKIEKTGADAQAAAKPAKAEKKAKKDEKPGFFQRVARWFREMKSELKKVVWPDGKTTAKNTGTVLLCSLIVGAAIWIFDAVAVLAVDTLIGLF